MRKLATYVINVFGVLSATVAFLIIGVVLGGLMMHPDKERIVALLSLLQPLPLFIMATAVCVWVTRNDRVE